MTGGTWIETHTRIKEHAKTYALMQELHIGKAMAIGLLVCLWLWAIDNVEDGDLSPYPIQAIARAAEWEKKPQVFLDALLTCGWVDKKDKHLFLHNWDTYAGRLIDKRKQARERAEKSRRLARSMRAQTTHSSSPLSAPCTPTVPNSTRPNQTRPNQAIVPPQDSPLLLVLKHWEAAFIQPPSPILQQQLNEFLQAGMQASILCSAIDETTAAGAKSPSKYLLSILQSWFASGIRDLPSLKAKQPSKRQKSFLDLARLSLDAGSSGRTQSARLSLDASSSGVPPSGDG